MGMATYDCTTCTALRMPPLVGSYLDQVDSGFGGVEGSIHIDTVRCKVFDDHWRLAVFVIIKCKLRVDELTVHKLRRTVKLCDNLHNRHSAARL